MHVYTGGGKQFDADMFISDDGEACVHKVVATHAVVYLEQLHGQCQFALVCHYASRHCNGPGLTRGSSNTGVATLHLAFEAAWGLFRSDEFATPLGRNGFHGRRVQSIG